MWRALNHRIVHRLLEGVHVIAGPPPAAVTARNKEIVRHTLRRHHELIMNDAHLDEYLKLLDVFVHIQDVCELVSCVHHVFQT